MQQYPASTSLGVGRLSLRIAILVLGLAILAACGGREDSGSSGDPGRFAGDYTGTFEGDEAGVFTMTVDDEGGVTGDGENEAEEVFTFDSGGVDGDGNLVATTSLGAAWTGVFTESVGVAGTWVDEANVGTFSADLD